MKISKSKVLLIALILVIPPIMMVASCLGSWENLRVYTSPSGDMSLRVETYIPTFKFFDPNREKERLHIERNGWEYSAEFSIGHRDDKELWMDKCTVEWNEKEVVLNTPDGYSIHLQKDYNPG